ncbi:MAG TPA: glycosyltransferase family 2 protein [Bacteroidales bacterium]|nr:glycosyltransferase family 2 protein [Bacteroidales bacterium]
MKISVIIAAYNAGGTISRTLESIIRQSRLPDEIIVMDDGSTDNTADVIKNFPGVKYFHQENKGPAAARNNGVRASHGDYISFLDSDDYWEENHLKTLTKLIESNPDLKWAATAYRKRLMSGEDKIVMLPLRFHSPSGIVDYFSATPELHFLSVISTAVRREFFMSVGGFAEGYSRGEDLSLWLRLALAEPVLGYCPEPTAVYVETPSSLTAKRGELSSLVNRIIDDWECVCRHPKEKIDRAWPVVRPWVSGILIKILRSGDHEALDLLRGVFKERLSLWQKTAIRVCRLRRGK